MACVSFFALIAKNVAGRFLDADTATSCESMKQQHMASADTEIPFGPIMIGCDDRGAAEVA